MTRIASRATAVIVGAGGLGGPIALALADAGLDLIVFDDDQVDLSNLHRQVQFTMADVGRAKAQVLAAAVSAAGGVATAVATRFTEVTEPKQRPAVIVDGSDDPATKFAVARWARRHRCPYVIASALRYGGNVFAAGVDDACYACLFEDPPDDEMSCAQAGVLGPAVAWVGGVAARAAIAALDRDRPSGATVWVLEDLRHGGGARTLTIAPRVDCACQEAQ